MLIQIQIQLQEHDTFDMSSAEVADAVFQALGADEDLDYCTSTITQAVAIASTGTEPAPPEMPEPPQT